MQLGKFKAAIVISQMDKKNRSQNKDHCRTQWTQIYLFYGKQLINYQKLKKMEQLYQNMIQKLQQYKIPCFEGMLLKKSPHYLQGQQQRWKICKDNRIIYYLPEDRNSSYGNS